MHTSCLHAVPLPRCCQHTAQRSTKRALTCCRAVTQSTLRRPLPQAHSVARNVKLYAASTTSSITEIAATPVLKEDGSFNSFPNLPGVYAIYDGADALQYIGISRRVALSIANHVQELPSEAKSAKVLTVSDPSREALTTAWKQWLEQAVAETGSIPPGNMPGVTKWAAKKAAAAKPEIKLTPGKGVEDLTCTVDKLIEQVVKSNKVVAFIKGTRKEPQCGFSYRVVSMLTEVAGSDYEVVNVLDEVYNPGLRDAIKQYSAWPTIPQVYVKGEFVGGCDIVEQMYNSGELQVMLKKE